MPNREIMLSRVADSIYWLNRYMERAESVARVIGVSLHLMMEQWQSGEEQWMPLVEVTADSESFLERYGRANMENVIQFLAFDLDYPHSIASSVKAARENARTVREVISTEMWEFVNTFHLKVQAAAAERPLSIESAHAFFNEVKNAGNYFAGIADNTMTHNEGWHFGRLGRMLERADKSSRILDVKYYILLPSLTDVGTAYDEQQWTALLRSASALEMYRKRFGRITPDHVMEFLVLDRDFPRSMLFCVTKAEESMHDITGTPPGHYMNPPEQLLGQLRSDLAFTGATDIAGVGLHEYLDTFQTRLNRVGDAIYAEYFATRPVPA